MNILSALTFILQIPYTCPLTKAPLCCFWQAHEVENLIQILKQYFFPPCFSFNFCDFVICMQARKQQLKLDMVQQTGSK